MKASYVLCAAVVLLCRLTTPLLADYEQPVCTHGGSQVNPSVGGDIVVWEDSRPGSNGSDIYGFNVSAGPPEFPVCSAPGDQALPDTDGATVVWQDCRDDPIGDHQPRYWHIYAFDLATGVETLITNPVDGQWAPKVSGHWVVWEEWIGPDVSGGYRTEIHAYDLATHSEQVVASDTTTDTNALRPDVSGDIVVWDAVHHFSDPNAAAVRWVDYKNLATGATGTVCTPSGYPYPGFAWRARVSGTKVVWEDNRWYGTSWGNGIYVQDIAAGGAEECILGPFDDTPFAYPDIWGDWVVWRDYRYPGSGSNQSGESFVYDLNLRVEYPLSLLPGVDVLSTTNKPRIDGNHIVYADYRNPGTGPDVYMYEIGAAGAHVTYNPYAGLDWTTAYRTKVQLHAHTKCDWSPWTQVDDPAAVLQSYSAKGYSFVALTDAYCEDQGFPTPTDPSDPVGGAVHIKDSVEDQYRYLGFGSDLLGMGVDGSLLDPSITASGDKQARVSQLITAGGWVVIPQHPFAEWPDSSLLRCYGYGALEVWNNWGGLTAGVIATDNDSSWKAVLDRGRLVFGTADDDWHPGISSLQPPESWALSLGQTAVWVLSDGPVGSQDDLLSRLRAGSFYSTVTGTTGGDIALDRLSYDEASSTLSADIGILCSESFMIYAYFDTAKSRVLQLAWASAPGGTAHFSRHIVPSTDRYVRLHVITGNGMELWTQPIFLSPIALAESSPLPASASAIGTLATGTTMHLAAAYLDVPAAGLAGYHAAEAPQGELVPVDQRPTACPPGGYAGDCYEFAGTGTGPYTIRILYDVSQAHPFAESSLQIYHYDPVALTWTALPTALDTDGKVASAASADLGLFALSGQAVNDTTPPSVSITEPAAGTVSGQSEITADASDDNGVTVVRFYLDDIQVGEDMYLADGWSCPVDYSVYPSGSHTVKAVAVDASGNEGEGSVAITITSGTPAPTIAISTPVPGASIQLPNLSANGTWSDDTGLAHVVVYLDDMVIGVATIGDHTWSYAGSLLDDFVGPHVLRVVGWDGPGNPCEASAAIALTVQPPTADFTASPLSGIAPLPVQFTDASMGAPTAWQWSFGDGTAIVTQQSPSHTYAAPGVYTVSLTVSNAGGSNTNTQANYVTVTPASVTPPVADFAGSPLTGTAPLLVQFTDASGGAPTVWQWFFGDGTAVATQQSPNHTYTAPGTYTVSLTASNAGGSSTKTRSNFVTVSLAPVTPPVAGFGATPTAGVVPLMVQFSDASTGNPSGWLWDFGDASGSTQQNPQHQYTRPGLYTVSLAASNPGGSSLATKSNYLLVSFADVPLDFWALQQILTCVGANIVQGYEDGYHPADPVTRDQMSVYISRALAGGDANVPSGPATAAFDDVPTDHWAYRYVEYCHAHDVVEGYSPTTYAPDEVVDRGQMAVYVARAVAGGDSAVPPDTDGATFTDVTDTNDWAWCYRYVEYCAANGIVQGYSDGTYQPQLEVTRDQMAVYVQRAFHLPM